MKTTGALLIALLIGVSAISGRAAEKKDYPEVAFVGPGGGKSTISRDQFLVLVLEGPFISFETSPIPAADTVEFINNLLKIRNVSHLALHTREGVKYGDVIRAVDQLRQTNARQVGVSMIELPFGREP